MILTGAFEVWGYDLEISERKWKLTASNGLRSKDAEVVV